MVKKALLLFSVFFVLENLLADEIDKKSDNIQRGKILFEQNKYDEAKDVFLA